MSKSTTGKGRVARGGWRPSTSELMAAAEVLKFVEGRSPKEIEDLAGDLERRAMTLRLHAAHQAGFAVPPVATYCTAASCGVN